MDLPRTFASGALGGVAMWALFALASGLGLDADVLRTLGSGVAGSGWASWLLGSGMVIAVSTVVAPLYVWGFEQLKRASLALGAGFGVAHGLVASLGYSHLDAETGASSGLWGVGWAGVLLVAAHIVYGALIAGRMKRQIRRPRLTAS